MKVLSSWLREFVNPEVDDEALANQLTMAGLEVDGIESIAPNFTGVIVGEVVACEQHPNADKLNLCQVNIGTQTLQIICGASNVRIGIKVAVAINGAVLPNNFKIKKAKLRGIESNGMICSEAEMGLADKSDGIMELASDSQIGNNIRDELNLDDKIIALDITPNRGDCFSILGVAREVSANYDLDFRMPDYRVKSNDKLILNSVVNHPEHCPKYLTRIIKNIDNTVQTPKWMVQKLVRCGYVLYSTVVDITNFVLLELGQPLHAFDADKIEGDLCVRLANNNEKLALLNEQVVDLNNSTLVIADNTKPLAIAGVMGGLDSSTQITTTNIILESAFFDNILIAGKAREYGLHTESSLRFERGVDFNLTETAINRATGLILEICGGQVGIVDNVSDVQNLPPLVPITISYAKINSVLGLQIDKDWIAQKFSALNFDVLDNNQDSITIMPPSFRFDIRIEADLIEELARLYGYDKLPVSHLNCETNLQINHHRSAYNLKQILANRNYNEVITYSFIDNKMSDIIGGEKIKLVNPISVDMLIMRTSIIGGLLKTAVDNSNQSQKDLRIFETGLCFYGINDAAQIEKIAGLITGKMPNSWLDVNRNCDFYDLKADVLSLIGDKECEFIATENPLLQTGKSAKIIVNNEELGIIGGLSPEVQKSLSLNQCFVFELNLVKLLEPCEVKYRQFSNYQGSTRDISLLFMKEIDYQHIIDNIRVSKQQYLTEVKLIDVWTGEGVDSNKKSLTFSLNYQADDKTLTDEEIDNSVNEVLELLIYKYNAQQR